MKTKKNMQMKMLWVEEYENGLNTAVHGEM
jgi:hypothetical protein